MAPDADEDRAGLPAQPEGTEADTGQRTPPPGLDSSITEDERALITHNTAHFMGRMQMDDESLAWVRCSLGMGNSDPIPVVVACAIDRDPVDGDYIMSPMFVLVTDSVQDTLVPPEDEPKQQEADGNDQD